MGFKKFIITLNVSASGKRGGMKLQDILSSNSYKKKNYNIYLILFLKKLKVICSQSTKQNRQWIGLGV